MKRFATAFGLCALLLASGAAYSTGFIWDGNAGGGDVSWLTANNWTANSSYPGELTGDNTDTATIDDDTTQFMVVVDNVVTYDVSWVLVDAQTAGGDMTLKIDTIGDLDVLNSGSGYIQLIAGSHGAGVADDANLWVAAGTLRPDQLQFLGTTDDTGHAKGKFDVSVTVYEVTCDGTVDTYMEGYTDIEFTNSVTVDSKDLQVGDYNSSGNSGTVTLSGAGTLSACSVVIKGDSVSGNSTVTASNGAMLQTY